MRETPQILFGVEDQKLLHRVHLGRPSTGTFKVFYRLTDDDADSADVEFTGSVTVDSVDTTLDGDAGISQSDPRKLPLTSGTGVEVGRLYRLSENSKKIWVEVTEVDGNDVYSRLPLTENWTSSATFESTYVEVPIDNTWVADEDNLWSHSDPNSTWRVRLDLEINSATHIEYAYFDLVRAAVDHHLTIHDLERIWSGISDQLATDHRIDQGQKQIDAAWEEVQHRLHSIDLNEAGLRDNAAVDQFTLLVARRNLAESGIRPPGFEIVDFIELARTAEDRYFEQHFAQTLKRDVDSGTGGGTTRPLSQPIWSK